VTGVLGSFGEAGLLIGLGLSLTAGLAAGLSPCTLPTAALVVAYVGGAAAGVARLRGLWLSAAFVLGLSLTLATLGAVAAFAGGLVREYAVMNYVAAGVSLLLGTWMLGGWDLRLPGLAAVRPGRRGVLGAFLLGIPFAFAASPCTAPVTVVALTWAASLGHPALGAVLLFTYALGRSLPLLVVGTLAGGLGNLRLSETWGERVRVASGFLLVIVGLYLLYTAL